MNTTESQVQNPAATADSTANTDETTEAAAAGKEKARPDLEGIPDSMAIYWSDTPAHPVTNRPHQGSDLGPKAPEEEQPQEPDQPQGPRPLQDTSMLCYLEITPPPPIRKRESKELATLREELESNFKTLIYTHLGHSDGWDPRYWRQDDAYLSSGMFRVSVYQPEDYDPKNQANPLANPNREWQPNEAQTPRLLYVSSYQVYVDALEKLCEQRAEIRQRFRQAWPDQKDPSPRHIYARYHLMPLNFTREEVAPDLLIRWDMREDQADQPMAEPER